MNKKILLVLSFLLVATLALGTFSSAQAFDISIEGTGTGYYYQETNLLGSESLHDELTINAGLWHLDMDISDEASFSIDRSVSFTDPMHGSTVNQGYFAGVSFDTTYDDGVTEDVNVFGQLEIIKTYKNMHGPGGISQDYDASSSVDSYIQALTGSADSNFVVGLSGTVAAGDFMYYYDHVGTNGLKDRAVLTASDPQLDFGVYGSGGSGSWSTVDVYAVADFDLNVDGTIGYNRPSGSDGTIGYMTPNYDPGWSSTFTGTEVNFSGTLLDVTYSGFPTGGNWNHVYPSFGFTTEAQ